MVGEKTHFQFLKHQCTYDAMMHDTQGNKNKITYTIYIIRHICWRTQQKLPVVCLSCTEDGDKFNFNAILYHC